jgi:hemerythrin-like domain-containing protein
MQSIDRLKTEHDLIERALNLLAGAVARIRDGHSIPDGFAAWSARFFRHFADECHHAKEEDVLFPMLKLRGIPEQGGPIGVMLHEHTVGRDCVRRMKEAGAAVPFASADFAAAAEEYIPLLRQHIFKENNVLFRMAVQVMSDADDSAATSQYQRVEEERGLADHYDVYSASVAKWEQALAE